MKSTHQRDVEAFMLRGGQEVPIIPTMPNKEILELRANLIMEEALETIHALGCSVLVKDYNKDELLEYEIVSKTTNINLVNIVDGCCDLAVVTTGTLSACGIPDMPFQDEVNKNNLLKFKDGVIKDRNGKIMKPKNHSKPRIQSILKALTSLDSFTDTQQKNT
jgi:predicted HAD superfamily Cof-like phosphohydrolase